jgi:penicillin amidase
MRQVIDLGEIESAGRVITTGQSGHFMSPHYGDQVRLWLEGELHPVSLDPRTIRDRARATLVLEPVA